MMTVAGSSMFSLKDIRNAFLVVLWFMFLTFPLMVIKVNPIERIVTWRWQNMLYVGLRQLLPLSGRAAST